MRVLGLEQEAIALLVYGHARIHVDAVDLPECHTAKLYAVERLARVGKMQHLERSVWVLSWRRTSGVFSSLRKTEA